MKKFRIRQMEELGSGKKVILIKPPEPERPKVKSNLQTSNLKKRALSTHRLPVNRWETNEL